MDKFKRTIKTRIILFSILSIACAAIIVLDVFGALQNIKALALNQNILSFQLGVVTALGLISALYSIKYRRTMKDEKKLELLYNSMHDERMKLIRQKAGMPLIAVTSILIMFAGVIIGYFNETIFITLVAAGFAQMMISNFVKLYYMNKM